MSKENQKLSYSELMEELADLCKKKSSGTMFIVSDKGHSSRLSLEDGTILFFAYRMRKGLDALMDLYEMKSGKYHFSKGVYNPYNVLDLPATSVLLQHLKLKTFPKEEQKEQKGQEGQEEHGEKKVATSNAVSIHSSLDEATQNTSQKTVLSTAKAEFKDDKIKQIIHQIEISLTNYLGPFADISIHDYLADNKRPETQAEFKKMIDFLTLEIDDRKDQTIFKNEVIKFISQ